MSTYTNASSSIPLWMMGERDEREHREVKLRIDGRPRHDHADNIQPQTRLRTDSAAVGRLSLAMKRWR